MTASTFVASSRRELSRLSAFTLPNGAKVPGLSVPVIRTAERHGLIGSALLGFKEIKGKPLALSVWRRRKRGEVRVYTVVDVMVARLLAWLLSDGWTMQTVSRMALTWCWRYSLELFIKGNDPTSELVVSDGHDVSVMGAALSGNEAGRLERSAGEHGAVYRYPLRMLGISGGSLSRLQKSKALQPVREVWMHGKLRPLSEIQDAEVAARELRL